MKSMSLFRRFIGSLKDKVLKMILFFASFSVFQGCSKAQTRSFTYTIFFSVALFLFGTISLSCFNSKTEENSTETISDEQQEPSVKVNTDWIEKETEITDFINYNTLYSFNGHRIYVGDNNYTPKKWYHYKYSEARFSKTKVIISVGGSTYTSRIVSASFTMNRAVFGDKKAMIKTKDGFIEFWEMRDGSFSLYGKHKNLTFIFNDYFCRNEE